MKLQSIFETFERFELGNWSSSQLYQQVEFNLAQVIFDILQKV